MVIFFVTHCGNQCFLYKFLFYTVTENKTWFLIVEGKKGNNIIFEVCYFLMPLFTHFSLNSESYFRKCVGQTSSYAMVYRIAFVYLKKEKKSAEL